MTDVPGTFAKSKDMRPPTVQQCSTPFKALDGMTVALLSEHRPFHPLLC